MQLRCLLWGGMTAIVALMTPSMLLFSPEIALAQPTDLGTDHQNGDGSPIEGETTPEAERIPGDLTRLFEKIWLVTEATTEPAFGSLYVFLPNGTLLSTSCGETYRIATWLVPDREIPDVLEVTEDGEVAYRAEFLELTSTTLRLRQDLVRSGETVEVTFTAVEEEFVCPDLPR
ncbi:hypothetical protein [Egbenema bharatensis]|uniref:hypothetical protein n=1 Tax=Egbenema bharatensis TaxID=3463334 RepID=UPI003A89B5D3